MPPRKSKTNKNQAPQEQNDSGLPGGGKGRKDEVGGSGVYPASGPLPEGDAEVQGMASWGQGERGAEGYNDSGRSEIWHGPGQASNESEENAQPPTNGEVF